MDSCVVVKNFLLTDINVFQVIHLFVQSDDDFSESIELNLYLITNFTFVAQFGVLVEHISKLSLIFDKV